MASSCSSWWHDARADIQLEASINAPRINEEATTVSAAILAICTADDTRCLYACMKNTQVISYVGIEVTS